MEKECVVCGYNHYVEKHHPDGKHKVWVIFDWIEGEKSYYGDNVEGRKLHEEHFERLNINQEEKTTFNSYTEEVHIFPDKWIYLCANCHNLVHRKNLSIDEIKRLYERDDDFLMELYTTMEYLIGKFSLAEIKIGKIEHRKRQEFLKTFIGSVCQYCGKRHRITWAIQSCIEKNDSERLFIEYMEKEIKEKNLEMNNSGNQDNKGKPSKANLQG